VVDAQPRPIPGFIRLQFVDLGRLGVSASPLAIYALTGAVVVSAGDRAERLDGDQALALERLDGDQALALSGGGTISLEAGPPSARPFPRPFKTGKPQADRRGGTVRHERPVATTGSHRPLSQWRHGRTVGARRNGEWHSLDAGREAATLFDNEVGLPLVRLK